MIPSLAVSVPSDELAPFVWKRLAKFRAETIRSDRTAHSIVLGSPPGVGDLNLRSNDYLAVGQHPAVTEAQVQELRRSGNHQMMSAVFLTPDNAQAELEGRFSAFVRSGASVIFQSGYQANTALIQTMAQSGTPVYVDQMAHASLYQGVLAAGADLHVFRHNDVEHLRRQVLAHGAGVIAIDSVYSTDGSLAPIAEVLAVAEDLGAELVVDESHSLGTHGPGGAGLVVDLGLERRIRFRTASLAKALCGRAGLVACPSSYAHYLRFAAFPSIFSSAILPHELAALAKTLEIVRREDWRRAKLHRNADALRIGLARLGYNVSASESQIISLEAGTEPRIVRLADALQSRGVFGAPFFAPATAKNRACIRLSVHAALAEADIAKVLSVCDEIRHEVCLSDWGSTRRLQGAKRRTDHVENAKARVFGIRPSSDQASRPGLGVRCQTIRCGLLSDRAQRGSVTEPRRYSETPGSAR